MRNFIAVSLLIFSMSYAITSCMKQDKKHDAAENAVRIILKHYIFEEPNPIYREYAKKVSDLFRYALKNRNVLNKEERATIYNKIETLCSNADQWGEALEDAVDERRFKLRESFCAATKALVSTTDDSQRMYREARNALRSGENGTAHELLEEEFAATVLLELLSLSERDVLTRTDKKTAIAAINALSTLSLKDRESFLEVVRTL